MANETNQGIFERLWWWNFALCKGDDPNLWVIEYESAKAKQLSPVEEMLLARAQRICEQCPVKQTCLADVIDRPQPLQIRAGTVGWTRKPRRSRPVG